MKLIIAIDKLAHFGFDSAEEREAALPALRAEGFNYFARYQEVGYKAALQATIVEDEKIWPRCNDRSWYYIC